RLGVAGAPRGVDVLLVNPPSPDGGIWIRTQHRVGRRSRENMVWPQVSLAQMAALLVPDYSVEIVDAIAMRMGWPEFEALLRGRRPRSYLTQVTAPTLTNDMYGVFLARSLGAATMGFGTHVTPLARETLRGFPALDFVLRGEPELTLRELIDTLDAARGRWRVGDDGALIDATSGAGPVAHRVVEPMWRGGGAEGGPGWGGAGPPGADRPPPARGSARRHQGPRLARPRRDRRQRRPAVPAQSRRPADALAPPAAARPLPHADDQGAVHLHRHQPRMPGGLHVLH